jgi:hypothetical protein
VSLGIIATAFAPVAVLFMLAGMAAGRWGDGRLMPRTLGPGKEGSRGPGGALGADPAPRGPGPASWGSLLRAVWLPAAAEALLLTLLAALWFGSLGHGGWLLVFLLLGALVAGADRWTRRRLAGAPRSREWRWFALGLLKYLAAGAALSWLLS